MHPQGIILFLVFFLGVSAFNIKPLRAGTIRITDADIRSQQKIYREIHLHMKKDFYQAHKAINVIASITSLTMDDRLNFYFQYNITCPQEDCLLNFTFIRKTQTVNPFFKYSLIIDYLLAMGLRIYDLNMTSYQEHLMLSDILSYNQQNQRQNLGKHLPYNNQDAPRALLFPNGFSNLTRTGRVVHMYVMTTEMYVIHYMDHQRHSQSDSQGWPQDADYISYKIAFFDADYEPAYECKTQDQFNLQDNFQKLCGGGRDLKWFFGFKRTQAQKIQGQFFEERSGFAFSLNSTPTHYGLLAFPFVASEQFIDKREHEYKFTGEYLLIGQVARMLLISGFLSLVIFLSYKYISRIIKRHKFNRIKLRYDHHMETEPRTEVDTITSAPGQL